jgi:dTDP-4-dehydrorhamnose reductase
VRTVLVLGAGGLVGSHVTAAFVGDRVIATYHRTVPAGGFALDITDANETRMLIDRVAPDVVVLAAAEPWVERCEREPEATHAVNVDAAGPIAQAARDLGALLVVFSSEYVFDGTKGRYTEEDPVRPINEYGRQKVELEAIARTVPRHLICRTSGVFGWERRRKNFVCQLLDSLQDGREFVVPADQLITPTFAPDVAWSISALVDAKATGTVHVVGPRILSRPAFAMLVCEAFDLRRELVLPRETAELSLIASRPPRAGLSDDRLRALLGRGLSGPADALRRMRETEPETPTHH